MKCFRRKYLKTSNSRGCGNVSPILKNRNKRKRKRKEKESYIFNVYIIFNIKWWRIVHLYLYIVNQFTLYTVHFTSMLYIVNQCTL